jgi:hypothetical protein
MIDEEWLRSLDFTADSGLHIRGLVGLGAHKVTLGAVAQDRKELVLQTYRHHLGYHIREIPLMLSGRPLYNVDRVNKKLTGLVGSGILDEMTCEFGRLFSSVLKLLHEREMQTVGEEKLAALIPLLGLALVPSCPEAIHFLFCTPFMTRRLEEIASLPAENFDEPTTSFPQVNGPNFPIDGARNELLQWAQRMLAAQTILKATAPIEPDTLGDNPIYVWGAAVMDGFFTDKELQSVANYIKQTFGPLSEHHRAGTILLQISAVADLLACTLKESKVARLVKLCGLLGFMLDVYDREGNVVASSMKL